MVKSFKTYVLGASLNPQRYSNKAILMLKRFKIPTVAFGIKEGLAHGVKIESDLINYNDIHTVTIYFLYSQLLQLLICLLDLILIYLKDF